MTKQLGRNDPCVCGSGKKYKQCCLNKQRPALTGTRKFKATWMSGPKSQPEQETTQEPFPVPPSQTPDLIQRAYANRLHRQQDDQY